MLSKKSIYDMNNNNKIIGCYPQTINSSITFSGTNNILYCEDNVILLDSTLHFAGNNSVIWLSSNRDEYKLSVSIHNDSVFYMGKDNYINQKMTILLSEQKHCFIGNNCLFSLNIMIQNSDHHLIYSCSTGNRINLSKSIFIGDHVWFGQDVRILKGTRIDSGSIIGAMSVVAGKTIPHNSVWAGNPCQLICEDAFWDNSCVKDWTSEKTEKSISYSEYVSAYKPECHSDFWIYEYTPSQCIKWQELEKHFSPEISPMEKCQYLLQLSEDKRKNRFVQK